MILNISDVSKSFVDKDILRNVDLVVNQNDKIALVGANGVGKSTLFRCILGEEPVDGGSIHKGNGISIGYLKQVQLDQPNRKVVDYLKEAFVHIIELRKQLEALEERMKSDHSEVILNQFDRVQQRFLRYGGYDYERHMMTLITQFGFEASDLEKELMSFSGGQLTRIGFIRMLLEKPDILLLDEPTNHLDIHTIEWLEGYLSSYDGAIVLISHDRLFLDRVCRSIVELEHGRLTRYEGSYASFQQQKATALEKNQRLYQLQQKEIQRLETLIDKFRAKSSKAAFAKSKAKYLERMEKIEKNPTTQGAFKAKFQSRIKGGKEVLTVDALTFGYDQPLGTLSFTFRKGRRYAIVGANGTGKSTFMKTIAGKLPKLSGEVLLGHQIQAGYFDQQLLEMDPSNTVLDEVWSVNPELDRTAIRTVLGQFLFKGEDVFKPVSVLSGGEKVRVALMKLMLEQDNLLILDEPTNHLDIPAKEALENALESYDGTCIFVSHDRYFIEKIATDLLFLDQGKFTHTEKISMDVFEPQSKKIDDEKVEIKASYQSVKKARTQLRTTETALAQHYEDLEIHREARFDPEIYHDFEKMQTLNQTIDDIHNEIKRLEAKWVELSEFIELNE